MESLIGPSGISTLTLISSFETHMLCTTQGHQLLTDLLSKVGVMPLRYKKIQFQRLDTKMNYSTNLSVQIPVDGPVLSPPLTVIADAEQAKETKNANDSFALASRLNSVIRSTGLNDAFKSFNNGSLLSLVISKTWLYVFEHMLLLEMFDNNKLDRNMYTSDTLFNAMKQINDPNWTTGIPQATTPEFLEEYMVSRFLPSVVDKTSSIGNFLRAITGNTSETEKPIQLKLDAADVRVVALANARLVFPLLYPQRAPYARSSKISRNLDRSTFFGAEKIGLLINALPALSSLNNAVNGQFAFEQYANIPRSSALQLFWTLSNFFVMQDIPAISASIKAASAGNQASNVICNLLQTWESILPEYRNVAFNVVSLALSDLWRMARAYHPSLACIPQIGDDTSKAPPSDIDCYSIHCIDVFATHPLNCMTFPSDAIQHVASKFKLITVDSVSRDLIAVSLDDT
jgi:hypothetical protein